MAVLVGQIRTCCIPHVPWCATVWRHLPAELDPRPQLLEEAAAVGSEVLGYEFAWKLSLRRSVQNSLTTPGVETVDKSDCGAAGAHLASQAARSADL